ncbi:MAG: Sir2 family NAD-dependent protein deacetylase [Pseudomonadota bacterium]
MASLDALIEHAAELIDQADGLVVAAGAGMGVDSGLPDFRGKEGFWQAYPALAQAKIDFHEIASPHSFEVSPALGWGFYGHRLKLYRATQPHPGFGLLRQWGENALGGYSVFTSNVDGQFQKAGFEAQAIHECHGSLHHLQCMDCSATLGGIWPAEDFLPEIDEARCLLVNEPPRCPACGGLARPNVLMFSDWGWLEQRAAEQQARQGAWLAKVSRPVVIELGAGTAIPSVRHFSQQIVHQHGGRLVRINLREAAVPSSLDVGLPMGALAGLQAIAKVLEGS